MIDFSIEPEFQEKLDWMDKFVREECEAMDLLWPEMAANFETHRTDARRHLKPLAGPGEGEGTVGPATSARILAAPATARSSWR